MVFTSREFLLFFVVVTVLCFVLPARLRWLILLAASLSFYAASGPAYLLLLLAVTGTAYGAALWIEHTTAPDRRRLLLGFALLLLLAPLIGFKYLEFLLQSCTALVAWSGVTSEAPSFDLLLPLGISFFTFQAIAYLVDVYRGRFPAERHVGLFMLYKSFFPQLIAGPIERPQDLLPQLRQSPGFDLERTISGGRLMLWGAFKKIVIGDNLAGYVDAAYARPTEFTGLPLIVASVFFAFQIYCDFSGYVDMARGAARVLGVELSYNFKSPYGAQSVGEFWRRWHITLSTWFRDYVYVPLGGNRQGALCYARSIAVVFLLSGLWHGANWTFVVWGGLHGAYVLSSWLTASLRGRLVRLVGLDRVPTLHRVVRVTTTFVLICLAWIFFRADTLSDAVHIVGNLGTNLAWQIAEGGALAPLIVAADSSPAGFWTLVIMIAALFIGHQIPADRIAAWLNQSRRWQRWGAYYAATSGCLFFAPVDLTPFIYFRF